MRIIIACFLHIDELPPMMTALKVLTKKYEVLYIGVDDWSQSYEELFGKNIQFINLLKMKLSDSQQLKNKINNFVYWKTYKYNLRKAGSLIERNYRKGDLVWIYHEYTLMNMKRLKVPFYLTMYELHQDLFKNKCELKDRIRKATKVIVPEYTRAAIVQACVGLEALPSIVPNKPYDFEQPLTELAENPMDKISKDAHAAGKKVIIYSGIFLRERKLDTFIEAIQRLKDRYTLVFLGRKSEYLDELLQKYPSVKYLGFYNPPSHLSIIEKADVGILTYVADCGSINPVFCAPNKIWEYAKYGIPMLCNDIPGLKYTVEYNEIGYCCDINSVDSICNTLNKIYDEFEQLSAEAKKYYETVNVEKSILDVVEE